MDGSRRGTAVQFRSSQEGKAKFLWNHEKGTCVPTAERWAMTRLSHRAVVGFHFISSSSQDVPSSVWTCAGALPDHKMPAHAVTVVCASCPVPPFPVPLCDTLDKTVGDRRHLVTVELEAQPVGTSSAAPVARFSESVSKDLLRASQEAIENGLHSACLQGPLLGSPVQDVAITVHSLTVHPGTSTTMISACVSRCVQKALKKADKQILEPLMKLEVTVTGDYLSPVLADLAQRRGSIQEIQTRQDNRVVIGFVPLAEVMGYSTVLRTLTSGSASFALELSSYQAMNPQDQSALLSRKSGGL